MGRFSRHAGRGDRSGMYWLYEDPEIVDMEFRSLRWYPNAGVLQVAELFRSREGEIRVAKSVSIRLTQLAEYPDAIDLLKRIIAEAEAARGGHGGSEQ